MSRPAHGRQSAESITQAIGENIASLVEDGSTLEVGIGRIPHAVVPLLREKKDLGIHTEVITDAIIDLIDAGVITGSQKSMDRGKIVTTLRHRHQDGSTTTWTTTRSSRSTPPST